MICYDCPAAIHRQYEGEPGHWECRKTPGDRAILETPASSCGDALAHARALKAAGVPEWCPLNRGRKARPRS